MSCLELLPVLQMQLVAAEELQELNSNVVRVPHTELVRALSPALVAFPNFVDFQRWLWWRVYVHALWSVAGVFLVACGRL